MVEEEIEVVCFDKEVVVEELKLINIIILAANFAEEFNQFAMLFLELSLLEVNKLFDETDPFPDE